MIKCWKKKGVEDDRMQPDEILDWHIIGLGASKARCAMPV